MGEQPVIDFPHLLQVSQSTSLNCLQGSDDAWMNSSEIHPWSLIFLPPHYFCQVCEICYPWLTDPGNICAAIWPHNLSKQPAAPDDEAKLLRAELVCLSCDGLCLCLHPLTMDPLPYPGAAYLC